MPPAWHRMGNVVLQSGRTFRNMQLAYKTFGALNADKSNVILYPTSYSVRALKAPCVRHRRVDRRQLADDRRRVRG